VGLECFRDRTRQRHKPFSLCRRIRRCRLNIQPGNAKFIVDSLYSIVSSHARNFIDTWFFVNEIANVADIFLNSWRKSVEVVFVPHRITGSVPGPKLDSVVVAPCGENMASRMPHQCPNYRVMSLFNNTNFFFVVDIPKDDGPVAAAAGEHALVHRVPRHGARLLFVTSKRLHFFFHIPDIK